MAADSPFFTIQDDSCAGEEVLGASRVLRSKNIKKLMQTSADSSSSESLSGDTEASSASQKKPKAPKVRSTIDWKSQRVRLAFYGEVKKQKAHLKTGVSTTLKFQTVATNLAELELFADHQLIGQTLYQQWVRHKDDLKARLALENGGANLSALPEDLSEADSLLYNLITQNQDELAGI